MQNVSSSNSQADIAPKLRFPEFSGNWQIKTLGDILSVKHGKDYKGQSNQIGKYPVMGTGGIITYIDSFLCDWECVCIGRKGTINKPIYMSEPFWSVDTLFFTQPQKNENPKFQYYLFETINWLSHNEASGVPSLSASVISNIKKAIPTIQEQNKLATFFTIIDALINKQSNLVENLKLYKRGALSRLFDEEAPHSTSWKKCKIGDYLIPRISKQIPTDEAPLMAFTAEGGVEPKGDRYDRSFLVKDENKQYKRTEFNDFIYSSNNLDVGSIGLNKYGTAVISDVYEIFEISKQANPSFISEAIKQPQTIYKILKYRQGVTYGQYRIYAEDFQSVDILLPSLEEQNRIAFLIDRIDRYISTENLVFENLNMLKKSLLQKMFI